MTILGRFEEDLSSDNIVFEIKEHEINDFIAEHPEEIRNMKLYGTYPDNIIEFLRNDNYKYITITSSIGLSGYIIAKEYRITKRYI